MIRVLAATFFVGILSWKTVVAHDVTDRDKAEVINAIYDHLQTDYVDAKVGNIAAQGLQEALENGAFKDHYTGEAFEKAVNTALKRLTDDGHLNIEFSEKVIPDTEESAESYSASEMEHWYGAHLNFGVQRVERLSDNIGILDLRTFAPTDMGGNTVSAAMNVLAHTDGLIIDLRKNGGGHGEMAALIASYLFTSKQQPLSGIYNRSTDTLTQSFTLPYVPGDRFGPDKPVYILTSSRTFSAAEFLTYSLQALGRVIVVGEESGGGAHPFDYLRIHPHFVLWAVSSKSVNPITNSNWQGTGVQPDILTPADKAMDVALEHMRTSGKIKPRQ